MDTVPSGSDRKYELAVDLTAPKPTPEQVEAREFAAGLAAIGEFFMANPHLMKCFPLSARDMSAYIMGPAARAVMEEFIAAGRAMPGATLAEYKDTNHGGVDVRFPGAFVRVFASHKNLADEPEPPQPAYRPLLGDEPTGGAE